MSDNPNKPSDTDFRRAESGYQSIIDALRTVNFTNKKEPKLVGEEKQRRNLPPAAMMTIKPQLATKICFEIVEEQENGRITTETVVGFVTGVFIDGFAYYDIDE